MTWSDYIYRGFLTYFERLNQQYREYILNIQKFNESYNESIKLIERANDIYKELTENYARVNQQWYNLFWRPFVSQQQGQEPKEE